MQPGFPDRELEHRRDLEHPAVERYAAGLEPRQVEQLLHETAEPLDLSEHRAQRLGIGRLDAVDEVLEHGLERGDRRAQLVTDVGDEVPAHAIGLGQLAAIWLNERASVPISSCDVTVTRWLKSPRAIASLAATISRSGEVMPRDEEPHHDERERAGDDAADRRPHTDADAGPEHDDRHRDRGEDDDAELQLQRRERIERTLGRSPHASRLVTRRRTRHRARCGSRPRRACVATNGRASRRCAHRRALRSPRPARAVLRGVDTRPGRVARYMRRSNSVGVRCSGSPAWRTRRVAGSSSMSPMRCRDRVDRRDACGSAQDRVHACDELARAERLGHVVVGTDFEPGERSDSLSRAVSMSTGTGAVAIGCAGRPRCRRGRGASGRARRDRAAAGRRSSSPLGTVERRCRPRSPRCGGAPRSRRRSSARPR